MANSPRKMGYGVCNGHLQKPRRFSVFGLRQYPNQKSIKLHFTLPKDVQE